MKRQLVIAAIVALLSAFPALADETLSLKLGYMSLTPSGQVAAGAGGTRIDTDLLMAKRSDNVHAEVSLHVGDHRLSAAYLPVRFNGYSTLTIPIKFLGITFPISIPLKSSIRTDLYDIAYTYYLINMDDMPSRFQFGIEGSLKIMQTELSLSDLGNNITATASSTSVIPTIGARGRVAVSDAIGLIGRIGYMENSGNHFLDADAQIEFSPLPNLGIYGGYRYINVKVDNKGVFADIHITGPYVGGMVRF